MTQPNRKETILSPSLPRGLAGAEPTVNAGLLAWVPARLRALSLGEAVDGDALLAGLTVFLRELTVGLYSDDLLILDFGVLESCTGAIKQ
mgnify:CR=1 FL=1